MPKQPKEGKTRSLADVLKLVESTKPADVVLPEVIHEGKQLLSQTARAVGRVKLDDAFMRKLLPDMIKDTSFAGAPIEVQGVVHHLTMNAYENMYAYMGDDSQDGAYNVWFERADGQWKVMASKVPSSGNYRS